VRVRDGSSFGLPAHIRIGVRPRHEQARLIAALDEARR
jgi:histidinol-phosphate/aromatic aminotransferase/cobyric acid decarboxylase-like protein